MYNPPKSPRRMNGKKFYHQGFYKPINVNKYIGDPSKIIYRSSWEYYFCHYCDSNPIILRWSCERLVVTYQDAKGKIHRYYPDFYIERADQNDKNNLIRAIVEIKPEKEINPDFVNFGGIMPAELYLKNITAKSLESYEYKLKTYQKNRQKWDRCTIWAEKNGMKFVLISEKYMVERGIMPDPKIKFVRK